MEYMDSCFFNDLEVAGNHEFGLDYLAAGIVESKHFDKEPNVSGKDYCVVFINPWGVVERQWRAASEIRVYAVGPEDYEQLKTAIAVIDNNSTEK